MPQRSKNIAIAALYPRDIGADSRPSVFSAAAMSAFDELAGAFGYTNAFVLYPWPGEPVHGPFKWELLYDERGDDPSAMLAPKDVTVLEDGDIVYHGGLFTVGLERAYASSIAPRLHRLLDGFLSGVATDAARIGPEDSADDIAAMLDAVTLGCESPEAMEIASEAIASVLDGAQNSFERPRLHFSPRTQVAKEDKSPIEELHDRLWDVFAIWESGPLDKLEPLVATGDERVCAIREFYDEFDDVVPLVEALYAGVPLVDLVEGPFRHGAVRPV